MLNKNGIKNKFETFDCPKSIAFSSTFQYNCCDLLVLTLIVLIRDEHVISMIPNKIRKKEEKLEKYLSSLQIIFPFFPLLMTSNF